MEEWKIRTNNELYEIYQENDVVQFIKRTVKTVLTKSIYLSQGHLFPTKSRCRFTQCIPNKPDKFGIKFWLAFDAIKGFPFLGKRESREPIVPLGEFVALKLAEMYTARGRNITVENLGDGLHK
uniref:DDE_Tnp_1_7 domain-containing protein n=1 Tax=Rhodnius prolixus TaxID=13249 RepID=T1I6T4_RHOPR